MLDRDADLRPTYLIPSMIEFSGPIDQKVLQVAVQETLARHPALRSRFRLNLDLRQVEYRTDGPSAPVGLLDAGAEGWSAEQLDRLLGLLCYAPFDLADEVPVRAQIIRFDQDRTVLVLTVHHIAFDGWSRGLVMAEIAQRYRARSAGQDLDLGPGAHPADVLLPMTKDDVAEQLPSVLDRLGGAPIQVALPFRRQAEDRSSIGATVGGELTGEITGRLLKLSADQGCTLFMTGIALLTAAFARSGGQRDFIFAFGWPGRENPDATEAVGMLMNTAMLRIGLDHGTTWRTLLRAARLAAMEAFMDGEIPLDATAAALNPQREAVWPPLTNVLLNLADVPAELALAPGVVGRYLPNDPLYIKYDLAFFINVVEGRLRLSLDYPVAVFERPDIVAFLDEICCCGNDLAQNPEDIVLDPDPVSYDLDDPTVRRELVRSLWLEILKIDDVGDDVSFFDAGGDSLLIVVLVERLSQVSGRVLRTIDIFRAGTITAQADLLEGATDAPSRPSRPAGRDALLDAARRGTPVDR